MKCPKGYFHQGCKLQQFLMHWHRTPKFLTPKFPNFNSRRTQVSDPKPLLLDEPHNRGSALPLLIGILLLVFSTYMVAMNIYVLSIEKMKLERWGEDFIVSLYQELAHQEYYFGATEPYVEGIRSFIEVDCNGLIQNMREKFKLASQTKVIISASCASNRLRLSLSEEVRLPFIPQGLSNFQPKVVAHIEAGLQRVRTNR